MSEYHEFSSRSAFCRTFAATITDQGHRAAILEMAEKWAELAERARIRESGPPSLARDERTGI